MFSVNDVYIYIYMLNIDIYDYYDSYIPDSLYTCQNCHLLAKSKNPCQAPRATMGLRILAGLSCLS